MQSLASATSDPSVEVWSHLQFDHAVEFGRISEGAVSERVTYSLMRWPPAESFNKDRSMFA